MRVEVLTCASFPTSSSIDGRKVFVGSIDARRDVGVTEHDLGLVFAVEAANSNNS